jgi:hypothetical protein
MNIKLNITLVVSYFTATLFFYVVPLQAYVLQGRHVLDLMIEKVGVSKSLFVSEKIVIYRLEAAISDRNMGQVDSIQIPANSEAGITSETQSLEIREEVSEIETLEFEGTLRYVFSKAFRSDAKSLNSERIQIAVGGRTLTIVDGHIEPAAANRFDLYKDILLYRSRETLAERLVQLGVDVSISSLGRFEDQIAFVLGAYYPDDSVNQLWVDKDTLLPLRLILTGDDDTAGSAVVEVRYLIWWKIGQTQYPSRIEFYQDDHLVRVSQAKSFEENAIFSEDLFDIEHQRLRYPMASTPATVPESSEEPSEVQKAIEEFKRIFE